MPLQANTQRKRRGMKANEDRQKRKTIMFIASGVFCLFLWISSWYCIFYFFFASTTPLVEVRLRGIR